MGFDPGFTENYVRINAREYRKFQHEYNWYKAFYEAVLERSDQVAEYAMEEADEIVGKL